MVPEDPMQVSKGERQPTTYDAYELPKQPAWPDNLNSVVQ